MFTRCNGVADSGGRSAQRRRAALQICIKPCAHLIQNLCTGTKLSEYHSGYRAFSHEVLSDIEFQKFSDNHIFDNEMLCDIILRGYKIGEITCPANYSQEASALNFKKSLIYGIGVLRVSLAHLIKRF